jgi:hypothetical protein
MNNDYEKNLTLFERLSLKAWDCFASFFERIGGNSNVYACGRSMSDINKEFEETLIKCREMSKEDFLIKESGFPVDPHFRIGIHEILREFHILPNHCEIECHGDWYSLSFDHGGIWRREITDRAGKAIRERFHGMHINICWASHANNGNKHILEEEKRKEEINKIVDERLMEYGILRDES